MNISSNELLKTAGVWLIDYIRWSQMVPMIAIWLFMLFGLAGMTLVNFQDQSIGFITAASDFWASQSWLPQFEQGDLDSVNTDDGGIHLGGQDFAAVAFKIWGGIALLLFVIDLLRSWLIGPPAPPNLKRQLIIAAVFAVALFVGFVLNFLFGSEEFNDSPVRWAAMFFGLALIAWLVSAYSLVLNYVLGLFSRKLQQRPAEDAHTAI